MEIKVGGVLEPVRLRMLAAVGETTDTLAGVTQATVLHTAAFSRQATNLFGAFLEPTALVALALGMWRMGADLGWTGQFIIADGLFSHWQVWIALAIALKLTGKLIKTPQKRAAHRSRR